MPRYYFDVHTTDRLVVDEVGEELESPDVALEVAMALLQCTDLGVGGTTLDATVRDQTGRAIVIATLAIRVQRLQDDRPLPSHQSSQNTPALIERSRALVAGRKRAAAELDQAVHQSARLVGDIRRSLFTGDGKRLP